MYLLEFYDLYKSLYYLVLLRSCFMFCSNRIFVYVFVRNMFSCGFRSSFVYLWCKGDSLVFICIDVEVV